MRKAFIKTIEFFKRDHLSKYLVQTLFFIVILVAFLYLATQEVISNVVGVVVGFLFSSVFLYILRLVLDIFEDFLKINYDTDYLLKVYNGDNNYKKSLELNKTKVEFAYAESLVNRGYSFKVVDDKNKMFQLDDFVMENYPTIFSAHSSSVKVNSKTVRLDKFELDGDTCTMYLSRSTVFNHLVTNRAIDFDIFEGATLRDIYEYGPNLSSYEDSKMSNHIGINALVFLSDGRILVPRRNRSSTISKNQITSSIAVKLDCPKGNDGVIDADYLMRDTILDNLIARVRIRKDGIDPKNVDIHFLGFGQNVYEGGKPQFYYAVFLKDIDTKKYFELLCDNKGERRIDVDKCIYVADYSSYTFKNDTLNFNTVTEKGKNKKIKVRYERSYICNLWHYEQYKKLNKVS